MGGGRAWRHKTKDAKPLKLLARRPGSLIFSRQIIILMKKLISLFSFLLGAHSVFADAEMDRLKTSYEAAVERSVIPIRNTYEKELLKLMEKHTKAGNLTAALEVKAEIEKVTGKPVLDPSAPKPTTTAITKPKILEQYFIGKTWRSPHYIHF